ncbi:tRNA(fMet)-specific endonuclease VapC [Rhodoferax lithotrophicus]|uniref:Ribonuclease VapC n=1 Tax=Rhodoferax lithotrophicus TaxID=2798804 RepID=A0ABN6D6G9_9BURK|nr:PIN domain-containing protein [Rhodoferax sp. MIZ03]BCO26451.1 tRNA(fMet)-specific endonuclease VapC [Rhodoferax sp. MIZ03]
MTSTTDRYLLDTNIWSALIRRSSAGLIKRFEALERGRITLSPIVLGELQLGYYKGDRTPKRLAVIDTIRAHSELLTITSHVSDTYAQLRAQLEAAATSIGPNDTWIAAEALHHKLVLVTNNTREFERVAGLRVENWITP